MPKSVKLSLLNNGSTLGYNKDGFKVCFQDSPSSSIRQSADGSQDTYWKIGITVKNAVQLLESKDVAVSKPAQFLDIGYLCHLKDPVGLSIELLQQGFEGNEGEITYQKNDHPIGCQAILAHITIRSNDLPKLQKWCTETMENAVAIRSACSIVRIHDVFLWLVGRGSTQPRRSGSSRKSTVVVG
jgi:hypothetical protein